MRLSSAGEQLVAETLAELGLTERPMIVLGDPGADLDGLYTPDPPAIWLRPELPSARFREVVRHELYHYWQHRVLGLPPEAWHESDAEAFARRGQRGDVP